MTTMDLQIPEAADLKEIRLEQAFHRWMAMGDGRSFRAIAEELHVPVTTVAKHALKFKWTQQLSQVQRRTSEETMTRMVETFAEVNEVHIRELVGLRKKALEALQTMPLTHQRDAIKLLFESLKMERMIRGIDAEVDKRDFADLLVEKMKKVQVKVVEDPQVDAPHEFEMEEGLEQEPLELEDGGDG